MQIIIHGSCLPPSIRVTYSLSDEPVESSVSTHTPHGARHRQLLTEHFTVSPDTQRTVETTRWWISL